MKSRERVQRAINFQEADRVPIDLGGMIASGIAAESYRKLKLKLGLPGTPRVLDPRAMIAVVEEPVLKRFGADVLPVNSSAIAALAAPDDQWMPRRLFSGADVLFPPGTRIQEDVNGNWVLLKEDGTPSTFRMPKNGYYFDDVSFNRGDGGIDPAKFKPVDTIPDAELRQIEDYSSELYSGTDYALLGWGGGVCFLGLSLVVDPRASITQGMSNEWLMMLLTEKETCH